MKDDITAYLLIYVDDIVLTSSSGSFIDSVIVKFGKEFAIKD